jgi:hypothetical protein
MLLLVWIGLSVVVGVAANTRGRNGVGWGFLAAVISPFSGRLWVYDQDTTRHSLLRRLALTANQLPIKRSVPCNDRLPRLRPRAPGAPSAE